MKRSFLLFSLYKRLRVKSHLSFCCSFTLILICKRNEWIRKTVMLSLDRVVKYLNICQFRSAMDAQHLFLDKMSCFFLPVDYKLGLLLGTPLPFQIECMPCYQTVLLLNKTWKASNDLMQGQWPLQSTLCAEREQTLTTSSAWANKMTRSCRLTAATTLEHFHPYNSNVAQMKLFRWSQLKQKLEIGHLYPHR